jgi:quinolinate synthase
MATDNAELIEKILNLKAKKKAIILVHNYQLGEVQDIADFIGDSLELSQKASKTDAEVIVFCGVHFMAETASIICPDKTVLLPELHAGCPMANMITAQALRQKKKGYPGATVVCYINTSAAVKAESDICCTSANAVRLVEKLTDVEEIIFVPDQYLGSYVASQTGKKMILWPGYCPTHVRILPQDILRRKAEHPQAKAVVHPECRPEVKALADAVLSTGGMIRFARETDAREIIVGTEIGIIYRLQKENPEKNFIPASEQAICPRMKLTTLESVLWSLEKMTHEIKVPERIRIRARRAVDKMLEIT